ncbi:MAG TPA: hypothetical protein VJP88_04205 [Caulobacteraceae bacterium]|nr:hypothetical protein [Caulobacteraceae bacterium]
MGARQGLEAPYRLVLEFWHVRRVAAGLLDDGLGHGQQVLDPVPIFVAKDRQLLVQRQRRAVRGGEALHDPNEDPADDEIGDPRDPRRA